jgi:hypothetical protein
MELHWVTGGFSNKSHDGRINCRIDGSTNVFSKYDFKIHKMLANLAKTHFKDKKKTF